MSNVLIALNNILFLITVDTLTYEAALCILLIIIYHNNFKVFLPVPSKQIQNKIIQYVNEDMNAR